MITNDPIILNETGLLMLDEMKHQNFLLTMIAEQNRDIIYSDITQVANIVRRGYGPKAFPIGDQLIIPWKDMDDPTHNTDGTAYQVAHNIVSHQDVTLETGEVVPGMLLQWHLCSPYGVQFSRQQAFYKCVAQLNAGVYYITLGATWGIGIVGTTWSFTLTQNVPIGGLLSGFEGLPDQATTAWRVKSWATESSAAPIETVTPVAGATGTSLGTMPFTLPGTLNSMQKVAYGDNRWSKSGIRQYLNKSGASWFTAQDAFDLRPDEYAKTGFMSGYGADLIAASKPIKLTTALNVVEAYATTENTYDRFFLPSLEQINATPELATVEGPYFDYWRRRLGLSGFAVHYPTVYENYKIPALNAVTTPQGVRLRSATRGAAYGTWSVSSAGHVNSYGYAAGAYRFSPVCAIA